VAAAALSDLKWFADELVRRNSQFPQYGLQHLTMQVVQRCETLQKQLREVKHARSRS